MSRSDDAEASIITSLLLLPLIFFILITVIDVGMFYMNEATISKAARDGATTAATLGGVGSREYYAIAEQDYPQRMTQADLAARSSEYGFTVDNTIEALVAQDLVDSGGTYMVNLDDVRCHVVNENSGDSSDVDELGNRPVCEVEWRYDGLPLSGWGMVQSRDDDGDIIPRTTGGFSTSDLLPEQNGDSMQRVPRP